MPLQRLACSGRASCHQDCRVPLALFSERLRLLLALRTGWGGISASGTLQGLMSCCGAFEVGPTLAALSLPGCLHAAAAGGFAPA